MNAQRLFAGLLIASLIFVSWLPPARSSRAQAGEGVWRNVTLDGDAQALAPDGNTLWVGTWGGVLRWNRATGNYARYTVAEGLSDNLIYDLAVDDQGNVWAGTDKGLSAFDGASWTSYDKTNSGIPGEAVTRVTVGQDGRVWLHSREVNASLGMGVTAFDGSTWTTYTEANSDLADDDVRAMAVDLDGHLWFGMWDGDVSEFDGAAWTTYPNINFSHNEIFAIAVDDLNHKWFVSYLSPVQRYDGVTWESYTPENGCDDHMRDVAAGGPGLVWFATLSGLCSFDGVSWTRYHTGNSGLASDWTGNLAVQGQTVWVGYSLLADGVTQLDGSTWQQYLPLNDLPEHIGSIGRAVDDETWFGASPGVVVFDGSGWTAYDHTNSGLENTCVNVITEDENGHLWFAGGNCAGGIVELDGASWTQHYSGGAFPDTMVYTIAAGEDGRVWGGSRAGLSVYDGATWTTYNTSNSGLPNNLVTAIAIDGDGNVWPGCTTRFDGALWDTYASVEAAIEANYPAIRDTVFADRHCWLAGADLVLNYDPFIATVTGVCTTTLSASFDVEYNIPVAGQVIVSLKPKAGYEGGLASGAGALVEVQFTASSTATIGNTSPLALASVRLSDPFGRDFATSALQTDVNTANGLLTIASCSVYLPLVRR